MTALMKGIAVAALALSVFSTIVEAMPSKSVCGSDEDFITPPDFLQNDPSYSGAQVDWKGFVNAIDCVGKREHSFCTFTTRMFFHDAGAVAESPKTSGADGSLMLNPTEHVFTANVQHGEAPMVRYVLRQFVKKYNVSWADALAVAAAACSNTLGSRASIAEICHSYGVPFQVGKLDSRGLDRTQYIAQMLRDLPPPATTLSAFITFWKTTLNSYAKEDKWKFDFYDVVALMGAHALNFPHGCTRNAYGIRNTVFDNSYFKDLLSGAVHVNTANDTCGGKPCVPAGTGESEGCEFDQQKFEDKTEVALAQVQEAQKGLFPATPAAQNPPFVNWIPDKSRAVCFGKQCESCTLADTSASTSRPFCKGRIVGESFWPYTVNDGFLAGAAQKPANDADQKEISTAYKRFRADIEAFRTHYALGVCKLSNVATTYGTNGPTDIFTKVGGYIGKCARATYADRKLVSAIFRSPKCKVKGMDERVHEAAPFLPTN